MDRQPYCKLKHHKNCDRSPSKYCRAADRIYVMDKGKVIDSGTFHVLENKPGLFSEMLAKQKL
jgi:ABC-type branched-subunit amino acid transport system ATPase component